MLAKKPSGLNAPVMKYDLLTALLAHALHQDARIQRIVLRLVTLITARYNWQRNELLVGRREIARLWAVDERTVKRELATIRQMGWMSVKVAGVRGRVTAYALALDKLLNDTRPQWDAVGPDFRDRMSIVQAPEPETNVVPFVRVSEPAPLQDGNLWERSRSILASEMPDVFKSWFRQLALVEFSDGMLTLAAPTRFHASFVDTHYSATIVAVVQREDASVRSLRVIHDARV